MRRLRLRELLGIALAFGIINIYLTNRLASQGSGSSVLPLAHGAGINKLADALGGNASLVSLVTPLRYPQDYEQFTIRTLSWKREDQLNISLHHHASCGMVAQVQVVWCEDQGNPPAWLLRLSQDESSKIVLERRRENNLNVRFDIQSRTPTFGILSMDDDILRPCVALDVGFRRWLRNPDRMVGYTVRSHVIHDNNEWTYGDYGVTEQTNLYSLVLTSYAFLHRDYLDSYTQHMPAAIRQRVAEQFNCEDIAMSLWVSAQQKRKDALLPLLADHWAIKLQAKLYSSAAISGTVDHMHVRHACVQDFATMLGIQHDGSPRQLMLAPYVRSNQSSFECGATAPNWNVLPAAVRDRFAALDAMLVRWKRDNNAFKRETRQLEQDLNKIPYERGFIKGSPPWKRRFKRNH